MEWGTKVEGNLIASANWYRLDTAAQIYPAIADAKGSCVFRVAVTLNEEVDPIVLQQAANDLKPRFPTMYVKMKSGVFWYYYEENDKDPIVKPESAHLHRHIDERRNNDYHFTVFHFKNRISLEGFHGLFDGYGALEYLKALIFRYFQLQDKPVRPEGLVLTVDQAADKQEIEDAFLSHRSDSGNRQDDAPFAYRIRGTHFLNRGSLGVISGRVDVRALNALSKKHGATITQYLVALLTKNVFDAYPDAMTSKKPVNICVPVNIRRLFPSRTLRNFSLFFHTSVRSDGKEIAFSRLVESVKADFVKKLVAEKLQKNINSNVAIERNFFLRLCPLFLKNFFIRLGCIQLGSRKATLTISNLGNVSLPASVCGYVRDFEFSAPVNQGASHCIGVISYGDRMTISFARAIAETQIERQFFTTLADCGIDVEIQTNLRETYA